MSKSFNGRLVLDNVDLDVNRGEVHGLVGPNGSGKSTLIKILAGVHAPDPNGSLRLRGQQVSLPASTTDLRRLGIGFVHQDLGLADSQSVLENLRIEQFSTGKLWRINWKVELRDAQAALERFKIDVSARARLGDLSRVNKSLVAIARALNGVREDEPGILVLDEPTAYLSRDGLELLKRTIQHLADLGHGIILVTHNLDEILSMTSVITILRDGKVVRRGPTESLDHDAIIAAMAPVQERSDTTVGCSTPVRPRRTAVALSVQGLTGLSIGSASFLVRAGEVLGMTGLLGSGFEEPLYLIFGAERATSGQIRLGTHDFEASELSPGRAIRLGMALLPADRQSQSGFADFAAYENATLTTLHRFLRHRSLRRELEIKRTREMLLELSVTPVSPRAALKTFSGGNQQKILIGKWLELAPRILLLHEPGQGVDVVAKREIFDRIKRLAIERDTAIVVASSDFQDIVNLCDRVLVWRRGQIHAEMDAEDITNESLGRRALA